MVAKNNSPNILQEALLASIQGSLASPNVEVTSTASGGVKIDVVRDLHVSRNHLRMERRMFPATLMIPISLDLNLLT